MWSGLINTGTSRRKLEGLPGSSISSSREWLITSAGLAWGLVAQSIGGGEDMLALELDIFMRTQKKLNYKQKWND